MSARSTAARSAAALALLVVAACSGSQSPSPAAPSSTAAAQAGVSSGATIVGLVAAAPTTAGMIVSADGTGLSSPVDASSRFQLAGVPAGNVQLRFTASGVNATTTVPNVAAQQQVTITVQVSANSATIVDDQRGTDTTGSEVDGTVASLAGTCPAIRFSIGATLVTASAQTAFSGGACSDVANDATVEVKGVKQSDGSVAAQSIKVDMPPQAKNEEFEGLVSGVNAAARTFQVVGRTVAVTSKTVITHGSTVLQFSDLKVGVRVHVKGTSDSSGLVSATLIFLQNDNANPPAQNSDEISGPVSGTPSGSCPALTFMVKGTTITTTSSTTFSGGSCGGIKAGASVDVTGTRQGGGSLAATEVSFK